MDKLDFLDGETPVDATTPAETPEIAQPEGPARGPDGQFISQAPEPPPEPEPAPVDALEPNPAPATPPAEPALVPVSALQAEREQRQALARENEELRRNQAPAPQSDPPQTQPNGAPDPDEDPVGFVLWKTEQNRLNLAEDFARDKHGDELVDKARDWVMAKFRQNPSFQQEVLAQRNPYDYAVKAYEQDQRVSQVSSDDFAAYQAWKAQQPPATPNPAVVPMAPAAPLTPPPQAPPRSIAGAPSAGGPASVPTGHGNAYDGVFNKG